MERRDVSLRAVRAEFEARFDGVRLLCLIAAILENPRLKALGIEPDDSLKAAFRATDVLRNLPLRPIIRSLNILSGRKATEYKLSAEIFSKLFALAIEMADGVPASVFEIVRVRWIAPPAPIVAPMPEIAPEPLEKKPPAKTLEFQPAFISREDFGAHLTRHAWRHFMELYYRRYPERARELENRTGILRRFGEAFSKATKLKVPRPGALIYKIIKDREKNFARNKALAVECYDHSPSGLRFTVLLERERVLFSVEEITELRDLAWRNKSDGVTKRIFVLRDDTVWWKGIRI